MVQRGLESKMSVLERGGAVRWDIIALEALSEGRKPLRGCFHERFWGGWVLLLRWG